MSIRSKNWFAVLGFLAWKPMSGYDIKSLVDISLDWFWSISYGQIYPILGKLVDGGYASVETDAGTGDRSRNLYRLTKKGESALDEWLAEPVDLSRQRDEMQLKLFLGGHRDRSATIRVIRDFKKQQTDRLAALGCEYQEMTTAFESGRLPEDVKWLEPDADTDHQRKARVREQTLVYLLSIRQGVLKAEARITWCDEAIERLSQFQTVSENE